MAEQFYLERGFTPKTMVTEFNSTNGAAIWTPTTSAQVVLTALTISNAAAPSGTFVITMGNVGGTKVAEFFVAGSTTISPVIGSILTTAIDRAVFGFPASSPSGGWKVTCFGFEIGLT